MSQLSLYRRLYRELRATKSMIKIRPLLNSATNLWLNSTDQAPTWDYVVKKTRELQGNSDIKMQEDNLELLTIYVEYLENSRLHEELVKKHSGRGERSVEESAKIVGLKLPHEPKTPT